MAMYAYCRVSTEHQSLDRQIRNIKAAYPTLSDKAFFCEKWTGTTANRPEWKKLERRLQAGDTVIFDSVSRMSRQAKEGFDLYKQLYEKGISLVFLKEPLIDTDNYKQALDIDLPTVQDECVQPVIDGLRIMLMRLAEKQFKKAFEQAEKEVMDTRQRIKEGMTLEVREKMSASRTGKHRTTKKSLEMKPKILKLSKSFDGNLKDKEVIEILKLRPVTYYKYKKELKEERM